MGYSTEFYGEFKFDKPVTEALAEYINRFSYTRRMPRDNEKIKEIYPNWKELCFFGELGNKGEYFAPPDGNSFGQNYDDSIIDYNGFKESVHPGLWCQWVVNEDRTALVWDGGEKFYEYVEWLRYLINHFFAPLGYVLNGVMEFQGEEDDDSGVITVVDNNVNMSYDIRFGSLSEIPDNELFAELERRGYKVG